MDLWVLLLVVPALLAWLAQARVRKVYDRHGEQEVAQGITGRDAAEVLLARHGLESVGIERASGHLTDHYNPWAGVLRLTDDVATSSSVTALSIVGHEVAHAVQHAEGYRFMQFRTSLAGVLDKVTRWSSLAFVGSLFFGIPLLMGVSGAIMAAMVVFTLVTLPVERDASNRARQMLREAGLASPQEDKDVGRVLRAAAQTYLAALGQRLATFLLFVAIVGAGLGA
jgi:uncharacterized protein